MRRLACALCGVLAAGSISAQENDEGGAPAPPDPSGLGAEELARRREALGAWTNEPVALEGPMFLLHLDRQDGSFFLQDRRTGTKWFSSWARRGFAAVRPRGGAAWVPLDRVEKLVAEEKRVRFQCAPRTGGAPAISCALETLEGGAGVSLRFVVPDEHRAAIDAVRLLDGALWLPNSEPGGVALPAGMGEWHDAQAGVPLQRRLALEDAPDVTAPTALFLAFLRSQSPLLVRWHNPRLRVEVERRQVSGEAFPGSTGLFTTVETGEPEGRIDLLPLGKEELGVVDALRAYRQLLGTQIAEATLRFKTSQRPELRPFLGAALFRLAVGKELSFVAAARWAERLRHEIDIDEAAFIFTRWQESPGAAWPSLPARAEAGGDAGLGAAAVAIKKLGYLVGLEAEPGAAGGPLAAAAMLERAREASQAPALADLCAPQLFLARLGAARRDAILDGGRGALATYGRELFGLWGSDVPFESEIVQAGYVDGVLDAFTRQAAEPTAWPLFAATFGQFVRLTASAVTPDDPAAFLAHLLVGEVPTYALPEPGARALETPAGDARWCFARAAGWTEGKGLTAHEIFLKNTYEVASHLARIRYREPFLYHRSLVPDGSVKETYFGQDLRVLVNFGPREYRDEDDDVVLPPLGFFVRHPFLRAFHAVEIGGVRYEAPAYFVLRSLEGKMILRAEAVRVFHGFGPAHVEFGGRRFEVAREAVVKFW